ncbi:protein PROCA1 [Rhinophrynus dorsalis]
MWDIPALLISSVLCVVLGHPWEENRLGGQGCTMLTTQGQHTQYQVTDGKELVTSTWDNKRQLVSCSVDEKGVSNFLSLCRPEKQEDVGRSGYGGFLEAKLVCEMFQHSDPSRSEAEERVHRVKRGFTYPGTLWCGAGHSASSYEDLGEHKETDSCCRTHDHCAHVVHPFAYRYGYRNFLWHTVSHCQCDTKFKECLRKVNDTSSRVVGQAFFNVIKVPCFEFAYKDQCVERYWYGWCKKYNNETVAVPRESGLYDYGGDLIDKVPKKEASDPNSTPAVELPSEQPTLGQVMQATEDLLKLMMTVSPTSSDLSKVESTTKKKDKKKKERKNKKGKGLKGKKKGKSRSQDVRSPGKDIWGDNTVKKEDALPEKQPMDQLLDLGKKQEDFNDVLNDEPIRSADATPPAFISPLTRYEESKNITTKPHTAIVKPYTDKPPKKDQRRRKERRHRKKKPKAEPSVSENLQ